MDPTLPLCTSEEDMASWAVPGAWGVDTCRPDPTAAEMAMQPWVTDIKNALGGLVRGLSTLVIGAPTPHVANADGTPGPAVDFLTSHTTWVAAVLMSFGCLIGILRVIWTQRAQDAKLIGQMLLTYLMVSAIAASSVGIILEVGQAYSAWIIAAATPEGSSFDDNLMKLLLGDGAPLSGVVGAIALLITALASLSLVVAFVVRGGILLFLVGTLGVSVSMYTTDTGRQAFWKNVGRIVAFCALQPAVATIFALAFFLMGSDTTQPGGWLDFATGLGVLLMAVIALPVLLKTCVPVAAATADGPGGGGALGRAATMAAGRFGR